MKDKKRGREIDQFKNTHHSGEQHQEEQRPAQLRHFEHLPNTLSIRG